MNKMTAMVLASVLASPATMARISLAESGKGKSGSVVARGAATSTKTELEAEMKDTVNKAKAEVEFEKRVKNGVTKSKLSAEAEIVVPSGVDPATVLATVEVEINGLQCEIGNPPVLRSKTKNGVTVSTLQFQGSLLQEGTDPATDPITDKGLDCGAITTFPAFAVGDTVKVTIGGVAATEVILNGVLKLD